MSTTIKMTLAFSALTLSLIACGKKDEASPTTAPEAPAGTTSITAAGATTAAPAGGAGKILAQCMNKASSSCKETYRLLPLAAEEFCKGLDGAGVFTKGEKACPKDNLLATCEFAGQEQTEITYHYVDKSLPMEGQLEGSKLACSIVDGKFVEAPKPADTKVTKAPAKKKK